MGETIEERADRAYLALVRHMDRYLTCLAAGGVELYMCEFPSASATASTSGFGVP